MTQNHTYELANKVLIPQLGFGTWQIPDGKETIDAVSYALEVGYRHIDTAQVYKNEQGVGEGIKKSDVDRKDIFLTTKVWNTNHTYEEALNSIEESLQRLDVDYVDLLLIHWPNPVDLRDGDAWKTRNKEVWRALEDTYKNGKAKAIGISNFMEKHLNALLETAEITPHVNQLQLAPGYTQDGIVDLCRKHNILVEAYSPLGHGSAFTNPVLLELANKYNKTVAQVALRWSLQHGFLPLPKSQTPKNILSNLDVFDFTLTDEDVERLNHVEGVVDVVDPDTRPF